MGIATLSVRLGLGRTNTWRKLGHTARAKHNTRTCQSPEGGGGANRLVNGLEPVAESAKASRRRKKKRARGLVPHNRVFALRGQKKVWRNTRAPLSRVGNHKYLRQGVVSETFLAYLREMTTVRVVLLRRLIL